MIRAKFPMFRLSFFWSNLQWYLLRPPSFSPFFPYIYPMNADLRPEGYYGYETIHGQLAVTLLAVLTLAWLFLRTRSSPLPKAAKAFLGLLVTAFLLLFLAMAFYSNRAERYTADFQASLVLWIAVAAGVGAAPRAGEAGQRPGAWRLGFVVLALTGSVFNVLAAMQLNEHFEHRHPIAWKASRTGATFPPRCSVGWGSCISDRSTLKWSSPRLRAT